MQSSLWEILACWLTGGHRYMIIGRDDGLGFAPGRMCKLCGYETRLRKG